MKMLDDKMSAVMNSDVGLEDLSRVYDMFGYYFLIEDGKITGFWQEVL